MKHYGIWNKKISKWMMTGDGAIIWSTSRAVIQVNYDLFTEEEKECTEIREFIEKEVFAEIQIDTSTLMALLDEVADYVNGLPNKELISFIRDSFHVVAESTPRADGTILAVFKPDRHYADLLPALLAGEMDFSTFKDILHAKAGVGNESNHN